MDHKRYAGITLRMLTLNDVYYPALITFAQEFEAATGARIELETALTWWHLGPRIEADLASSSPRYDLFCNDVEFQYTLWPHLLPLNDYAERSEEAHLDDLFEPIKRYGLSHPHQPGVHYGLPLRVRVPMIFYRTDLISEFPTTWEAYDAMLAEHAGGGHYGLGFAGGYNEMATKMFIARYWSLGGSLLTPDGRPLIDSEKAVEALTMLKEHAWRYAPPGVHGWDYEYAGQMFREGHVAVLESIEKQTLMGIDDPEVSRVAGNWSVGLYLGGGANVFTEHHMVIFRHCRHPQVAFDFIAYCTNRENARRLLLTYGEDAARKSVWQDPAVLAARPNIQRMAEALDRGRPFLPWVPQWLEMLRVLWDDVSACLGGRLSPPAALDDVARSWTRLLEARPLDFDYGGRL